MGHCVEKWPADYFFPLVIFSNPLIAGIWRLPEECWFRDIQTAANQLHLLAGQWHQYMWHQYLRFTMVCTAVCQMDIWINASCAVYERKITFNSILFYTIESKVLFQFTFLAVFVWGKLIQKIHSLPSYCSIKQLVVVYYFFLCCW